MDKLEIELEAACDRLSYVLDDDRPDVFDNIVRQIVEDFNVDEEWVVSQLRERM